MNEIVIETARLLLRKMTATDAPFIFELLNDPAFLRYIGDKGVRTLDDAREYIASGPVASYEKHGFGLFLVVIKDTGASAGMCGLLKRDLLPHPDLGFAYLPAFRSYGYGFEAAEAVMTFARERFGLQTLLAITSPANRASIRLLEKLGFTFERTMKMGPGDEVRVFTASTIAAGTA